MYQNCTNRRKHKYRAQWGGSGAFVAKNSDVTLFHERSNGVDRMSSVRKIPTRLRGTNFCTSSSRIAPSFVRQPNGPKHTEVVRKHQNISLGSNGVDRVHSLRKILTRLRVTNFCISSARFAPSSQGNQTVSNAAK